MSKNKGGRLSERQAKYNAKGFSPSDVERITDRAKFLIAIAQGKDDSPRMAEVKSLLAEDRAEKAAIAADLKKLNRNIARLEGLVKSVKLDDQRRAYAQSKLKSFKDQKTKNLLTREKFVSSRIDRLQKELGTLSKSAFTERMSYQSEAKSVLSDLRRIRRQYGPTGLGLRGRRLARQLNNAWGGLKLREGGKLKAGREAGVKPPSPTKPNLKPQVSGALETTKQNSRKVKQTSKTSRKDGGENWRNYQQYTQLKQAQERSRYD